MSSVFDFASIRADLAKLEEAKKPNPIVTDPNPPEHEPDNSIYGIAYPHGYLQGMQAYKAYAQALAQSGCQQFGQNAINQIGSLQAAFPGGTLGRING